MLLDLCFVVEISPFARVVTTHTVVLSPLCRTVEDPVRVHGPRRRYTSGGRDAFVFGRLLLFSQRESVQQRVPPGTCFTPLSS